jgi:uncharacterized protein (TIGR00299 family) protein
VAKALFLESVAGVAGDMFTAAFLDAGLVTLDELNALPVQLGIEGVRVEAEDVIRASIGATHLSIICDNDNWKQLFDHGHKHHEHTRHHDPPDNTNLLLEDAGDHWHAHYTDIDAAIRDSSLAEETRSLARKIFRTIAHAEAEVHRVEIENAAFHEIGAVDSIMDVVMAAYCIGKAAVDVVYATPLKPGRGMIKIAHGTHPVPPPASTRLLLGMPVALTPDAITNENIELSTPTGIAIIKCLDPWFVNEMPAGTLICEGRGSGTRDLGTFPNVFRIAIVETGQPSNHLPYETDTVVEIVCNIDDDTAEHIGWMTEQLFELGAFDVWQTPATGKKGRVTICLSVLANESRFGDLADWILRKSTTFGIRYRKWDRLKLAREIESRETSSGPVRYKIGRTTTGEKLKEKPEFDDLNRRK